MLPEVDRLVLKRYPVLAGAGRALVAGAYDPTGFRPVERRVFADGTEVSVLER